MTAEQFVYWLQGFSELECGAPNDKQWKIIQDHLNLVFTKRTVDYTPAPVGPDTWKFPLSTTTAIC